MINENSICSHKLTYKYIKLPIYGPNKRSEQVGRDCAVLSLDSFNQLSFYRLSVYLFFDTSLVSLCHCCSPICMYMKGTLLVQRRNKEKEW